MFLFQDVLVITRAVTHNEQLCYQLYRQPIPVRDLEWEDLQDGEIRLGGSIRGAFSNTERSEYPSTLLCRAKSQRRTSSESKILVSEAYFKQDTALHWLTLRVMIRIFESDLAPPLNFIQIQ